MSDRLSLAHAIEDAGIERAKAERVASVIVAAIYDHAATKVDVQASEVAVRSDIAQLSATTRADLATMRGDLARGAATAQADVQAVRGELAQTRTELKADTATVRADLKAQPNAIMLRLGTLMVVLTGIILAALRYFPPPHG